MLSVFHVHERQVSPRTSVARVVEVGIGAQLQIGGRGATIAETNSLRIGRDRGRRSDHEPDASGNCHVLVWKAVRSVADASEESLTLCGIGAATVVMMGPRAAPKPPASCVGVCHAGDGPQTPGLLRRARSDHARDGSKPLGPPCVGLCNLGAASGSQTPASCVGLCNAGDGPQTPGLPASAALRCLQSRRHRWQRHVRPRRLGVCNRRGWNRGGRGAQLASVGGGKGGRSARRKRHLRDGSASG